MPRPIDDIEFEIASIKAHAETLLSRLKEVEKEREEVLAEIVKQSKRPYIRKWEKYGLT